MDRDGRFDAPVQGLFNDLKGVADERDGPVVGRIIPAVILVNFYQLELLPVGCDSDTRAACLPQGD